MEGPAPLNDTVVNGAAVSNSAMYFSKVFLVQSQSHILSHVLTFSSTLLLLHSRSTLFRRQLLRSL